MSVGVLSWSAPELTEMLLGGPVILGASLQLGTETISYVETMQSRQLYPHSSFQLLHSINGASQNVLYVGCFMAMLLYRSCVRMRACFPNLSNTAGRSRMTSITHAVKMCTLRTPMPSSQYWRTNRITTEMAFRVKTTPTSASPIIWVHVREVSQKSLVDSRLDNSRCSMLGIYPGTR